MIYKNELLTIVSTLNGNVERIIAKLNLENDCIIVNQCSENSESIIKQGNVTIYVLNSTSRGISKSRNIGLGKSLELNHEIILFADDDVSYLTGYSEMILEAYHNNPQADLIAFEFLRINYKGTTDSDDLIVKNQAFRKRKREHEYFSSVKISFRKSFLNENNIRLREIFGTGSNIYSHGEDSILVHDFYVSGANIIRSNGTISKVDFSESTWRNSNIEKILFDRGALWTVLSPKGYWFYGLKLCLDMAIAEKYNFFKLYMSYLKGHKDYKNKYLKA